MSMRYLGETFDIHGGGMDLIFPHHENEIAQSCGATGKEFARYWIHNGFVQINQEKMSKSLGNFFTIREIFEKYNWPQGITGEVLRYFLLATQYRGPLDFSDRALNEAKQALDGFYDLFLRLSEAGDRTTCEAESVPVIDLKVEELLEALVPVIKPAQEAFRQAMDDDFNTPMALAAIQNLRGDVNKLLERGLSTEGRKRARAVFRSLGNVLGLFQMDKWQFVEPKVARPTGHEIHITGGQVLTKIELSNEQIEHLVAERLDARKKKDFAKADEIRKSLESHGIIIEDKPDGTSRWKR
jgi:cysteinyl-tRNA synthetase